jgi:hypothetical protein
MARMKLSEGPAPTCPRCGKTADATVVYGRHTFCASCFEGWAMLNAERIVTELPPVASEPEPEPVKHETIADA